MKDPLQSGKLLQELVELCALNLTAINRDLSQEVKKGWRTGKVAEFFYEFLRADFVIMQLTKEVFIAKQS